MSKRFGRNQKRKLKVALSASESMVNNLNKDLKIEKQRNISAIEAVYTTQQALGEMFPTLPSTCYQIDIEQPYIQVPSYIGDFSYSFEASVKDLCYKVHTLECVEYSAQLDKLRNCMYVRVDYGNHGSVAFNIDTARYLPERELENLLIKDLVPHLVHTIKEKLRGKNETN